MVLTTAPLAPFWTIFLFGTGLAPTKNTTSESPKIFGILHGSELLKRLLHPFQHMPGILFGDARKPFQKVIQLCSIPQVFEKGTNRDPSFQKGVFPSADVGILLNPRATLPIHGLLLSTALKSQCIRQQVAEFKQIQLQPDPNFHPHFCFQSQWTKVITQSA